VPLVSMKRGLQDSADTLGPINKQDTEWRTYVVASDLLLGCVDQQSDPAIADDEEHRERQPV